MPQTPVAYVLGKMVLIKVFLCFLASVSPAAPTKFSLVIDTTESMKNEIDVLNKYFLKTVRLPNEATTDYYAIVPFNYPDVEAPVIAKSPIELETALGNLSARGGEECPENSLAGIIEALKLTDRKTSIFVFTDAFAKDHGRFDELKDLCELKQGRVVIFLSGRCVSSDKQDVGSLNVYNRIAEACSGLLVFMDPTNLRQAFKYINELTNQDWTITTEERMFAGTLEFTYSVNKNTDKGLMIAMSGDFPLLEILDANGNIVQTKSLIDTRYALVVSILHMDSTEYRIRVSGRSVTSVLVYCAIEKIQFVHHGFSTVTPRSLRETSLRPLPGWPNYTLLNVLNNLKVTLNFIEFKYFDGSANVRLDLKKHGDGYYITIDTFIVPDRNFDIYVEGTYDDTYKKFSSTIEGLAPQKTVHLNENYWVEPQVELLDEDKEIEYGDALTLACKATGYPRPVISWTNVEAEHESETHPLELPLVHINYLKLSNVTQHGRYNCEAKNAKGQNYKSIEISIHNIFDVLQVPEDTSIDYGNSAKLTCEAKTSATTTVKWYLNDTHLEEFDKTSSRHVVSELEIKEMSLHDVGTYTCEITGPVESRRFSANVAVSGLESPEIDTSYESDVHLKPGTDHELKCRIKKGIPEPEITWQFTKEGSGYFEELPSFNVRSQGGILQFHDVSREQKGLYRCIASNELGSGYRDFTITIQYAPILKTSTEALEVREGSQVILRCEADADPPATIEWTNERNDISGKRFYIDSDGSLVFQALYKDTGDYQCKAQNEHGYAQKLIKLNVLVVPYIAAQEKSTVSVKVGGTIRLPCEVQYGNPKPDIVWDYQNTKNSYDRITRDSSSLLLKNVSENHQGHYTCIATNKVGSDRIRYDLKVVY